MRLTGVAAAISIKLSSSIDDVVWLAPFLTANSSLATRLRNSAVYMSVCLVQTGVAMAIACTGDAFVNWLTKDAKDTWSTDKILTVVAGSMMAVYSVKLAREQILEWQEPDTDEDKGSDNKYNKVASADSGPQDVAHIDKGSSASRPLSARSRDIEHAEEAVNVDPEQAEQEKAEAGRTQALFMIAFIGSVDDLTLFVPMLVGKGFNIIELALGGFIAASSIVLLCMFVGLCQPIADCLSKIPLFAIVFVFATILLVKACMMD